MTSFRLVRRSPDFELDVEFPVASGATAIFGPARSGKSLLFELAAGFLQPDAGRVLFEDTILYDGKANVRVPPSQRRFGYVSDRDSLFPHLTVRENLRFAAQRFPRLDRHRRLADWLEKFQLGASADSYPRQLTGEQRLNGALARMLIAEPKLLLLDRRDVSESLLHEIRELTPAPVLFASSDLDLCCAAATQMVLLDAGRVVQMGAPRDVLARPANLSAARLLGIPNLFTGNITLLDPFRNSSVLSFESFSLTCPYLPAHFKGDKISAIIRAADLRVHASPVGTNCISVTLAHISPRSQYVRLEFEHGISADVSPETYKSMKDNKEWYLEFPAGALQVL